MQDDPVAELEAMLAEGEGQTLQWWESASFKPDSSHWIAAREEAIQVYQGVVGQITESWGQPDSTGTITAEEGEVIAPDLFPWSICEFVDQIAIWDCDGHVACVWRCAVDPGRQFEVCIGVAVREE